MGYFHLKLSGSAQEKFTLFFTLVKEEVKETKFELPGCFW